MKTKLTIALLAALGTFALAAHAQDDGGGPPGDGGQGGGPGGPGGRHHPPLPAIVLALDANHDGIIDSNEIANASAVLKTLDKNGDGQLTRDEYLGARPNHPPQDGGGAGDTNAASSDGPPPGGDQAGGPGGPGGGGHRHPPIPLLVRALDVNHDGIIDSNEIANASAVLKTLDKNGDGQLTRDEFMGPRPNHPPHDFGGGGNDAGGPPDGPPPGQN